MKPRLDVVGAADGETLQVFPFQISASGLGLPAPLLYQTPTATQEEDEEHETL